MKPDKFQGIWALLKSRKSPFCTFGTWGEEFPNCWSTFVGASVCISSTFGLVASHFSFGGDNFYVAQLHFQLLFQKHITTELCGSRCLGHAQARPLRVLTNPFTASWLVFEVPSDCIGLGLGGFQIFARVLSASFRWLLLNPAEVFWTKLSMCGRGTWTRADWCFWDWQRVSSNRLPSKCRNSSCLQ